MITTTYIPEVLAPETTADGFEAGFIRGYRTAVSHVFYDENPSMSPDERERFQDGFDQGYESAKDDIRLSRPMRYPRLGLPV